jgi:hypothetical protein
MPELPKIHRERERWNLPHARTSEKSPRKGTLEPPACPNYQKITSKGNVGTSSMPELPKNHLERERWNLPHARTSEKSPRKGTLEPPACPNCLKFTAKGNARTSRMPELPKNHRERERWRHKRSVPLSKKLNKQPDPGFRPGSDCYLNYKAFLLLIPSLWNS